MNSIYNLFVYGSLRSGFRNASYDYLTRYFTLAGNGRVKGRIYDTGTYPVAVPTTEEHYIQGELYQLNNPAEFSWAIEQIDDYEGLHVEAGETPLYKRAVAEVSINGSTTAAWIYWYDGPLNNFTLLEGTDILEYLQQRNKR